MKPKLKVCPRCKRELPLSDFGRNLDNVTSYCFECSREIGRERLKKKRDMFPFKYLDNHDTRRN